MCLFAEAMHAVRFQWTRYFNVCIPKKQVNLMSKEKRFAPAEWAEMHVKHDFISSFCTLHYQKSS